MVFFGSLFKANFLIRKLVALLFSANVEAEFCSLNVKNENSAKKEAVCSCVKKMNSVVSCCPSHLSCLEFKDTCCVDATTVKQAQAYPLFMDDE
ncbi:hypothetical protein T05_13149 [Trichinella murrelli]|uniref:Granulins domain-containing protein n=1 Tax=Trichinella murrelli TaxID=144512 RepID=A0A0V0TBG0_9BILA|nr:hypothetical protein T05_13149 [Trichinella murrelli]